MKKKETIITKYFRNAIIFIMVGVFVITVLLYLCQFHGSLSSDSKQWADFSTYFSGLIMPVFTCINIFVFIKLTIAIADGDSKAQQERHNNELAFRKKMLTIENQQYEVRKFETMMDDLIYLLKNCYTENDVIKAKKACSLAENYIEQMKRVNTFDMIKIDDLLGKLFQGLSSANQGLRFGYDHNTQLKNSIYQIDIQSNVNDIIVKLKNEIVSTIKNEEYE